MPNQLRRLKIREVSSVDAGANQFARILLMKRRDQTDDSDRGSANDGGDYIEPPGQETDTDAAKRKKMKPLSPEVETYLKRNVVAEAETLAKREFSPKERRRAAARGQAMPGGGYPIKDVGDLRNAIRAIGRAKNPGATRAHIVSRARSLGQSGLIPDKWKKKNKRYQLLKIARELGEIRVVTKDAVSFDQVLAEMGSTSYAEGVIEAVRDAWHALKCAIKSTMDDDDDGDELSPDERAAAIKESYGQFLDHLSGIAPENVTKAVKGAIPMAKLEEQMKKVFTSVGTGTDKNPPAKDRDAKTETPGDPGDENTPVKTATSKKLRKQLKKALKKMTRDRDLWKVRAETAIGLEKAAKEYMNDPENDMDEDDKKKFLDLSPEDRAKFMKKHPVAEMAKRRIEALPADVRKGLEEGRAAAEAVAKRAEADDVAEFAKRATALGQTEEFGENLRKLAKGLGTAEERMTAIAEVEKVMTALAKQVETGRLFGEFGASTRGAGTYGTAYDQLMEKARELATEVNKTATAKNRLTAEQAFEKVYEDPANAELVVQYKRESRKAA